MGIIGGVNNSFTDKKDSSKWGLMNSKHIRNKSESRAIIGYKQNFNVKSLNL